MINDLRIQNIGVIEDVSLEMSKGFTVLTGETGAGKTMILTAFQMVIGEKLIAIWFELMKKQLLLKHLFKFQTTKKLEIA